MDTLQTFLTADGLIALVTLTVLEVVLGIDNIIFISILAGKLPAQDQEKARKIGLVGAMVMRILLLMSIAWLTRLTAPLFTVWLIDHPMSGRDLILGIGGLFLLFKATRELHEKLEGEDGEVTARVKPSLVAVVTQIMLLDIVFSIDSVITAVGMAEELAIMVTAMLIAVGVMLMFARAIGEFVHEHPTMKMLALAFLILIGVMLVVDGMGQHVSKGYIYFAMAFSFGVEILNLRLHKRAAPVKLHEPVAPKDGSLRSEP
jgi:predicted tellurium resistance membrane protein TerC